LLHWDYFPGLIETGFLPTGHIDVREAEYDRRAGPFYDFGPDAAVDSALDQSIAPGPTTRRVQARTDVKVLRRIRVTGKPVVSPSRRFIRRKAKYHFHGILAVVGAGAGFSDIGDDRPAMNLTILAWPADPSASQYAAAGLRCATGRQQK
jgi:hypothetical protein